MGNNLEVKAFAFAILLVLLKVRSYSALFTVRCGALTHVTLTFELEYDNAPHRTANNAKYELTFRRSATQSVTANVLFREKHFSLLDSLGPDFLCLFLVLIEPCH